MSWKLLEGKNYSTLEWDAIDQHAGEKDMEALREIYLGIPSSHKVTVVMPAGYGHSGSVEELGLTKIKERDVFQKDIRGITAFPDNSLDIIAEPSIEEGLECMSRVLGGLNEAKRLRESLMSEVDVNKFRIYLVRE
ncbi:hypothetical protein [Bacillus salacetis]|uniref:hypothetical protein n=1 Tax=Bacillus salacetis TaxID=2315464 RepID=UPI00109BD5DA|nr:hypothetical protein [Bacillus salacetis]